MTFKKLLLATMTLAVIAWMVLFVVPFPAHSQVTSYTLTWTAPGDDGNVGTATTYEMRWSTVRPDTTSASAMNGWWDSATPVTNMPRPESAGETQEVDVPGSFTTGTSYYFVIRTADEVPNWSGWSNVAVKFTADTIAPAPIIDLR